jgi:hypothetical protein
MLIFWNSDLSHTPSPKSVRAPERGALRQPQRSSKVALFKNKFPRKVLAGISPGFGILPVRSLHPDTKHVGLVLGMVFYGGDARNGVRSVRHMCNPENGINHTLWQIYAKEDKTYGYYYHLR